MAVLGATAGGTETVLEGLVTSWGAACVGVETTGAGGSRIGMGAEEVGTGMLPDVTDASKSSPPDADVTLGTDDVTVATAGVEITVTVGDVTIAACTDLGTLPPLLAIKTAVVLDGKVFFG